MVVACAILEQLFTQSQAAKNYFYYIASSVIDKHVIVDPGVIYKLMKGLPSGHPFTSLINTLCNWIIWSTAFNNIYTKHNKVLDDDFNLICFGDDTLLSFPDWIEADEINAELGRSGMKIDPIEDTILPFYTTATTRGVHFLRRQFCLDGLACWDGEYIVDRLSFVENSKENEQFSMLRASNYLVAGSGSNDTTWLLYDFVKWCDDRIYSYEKENEHYRALCDKLETNVYLNNVRRNDTTYEHRSFNLWQALSVNITKVVYLPRPDPKLDIIRVRGLAYYQRVMRHRWPPPQLEVLIKKTGMFRHDCLKIREGIARYIIYRPPSKEMLRDLQIRPPNASGN